MADSEDDQSENEDIESVEQKKTKQDASRDNSEVTTTKKRKKKKDAVTFCVTDCKYEVIFNCVKAMGWRLAGSVNEEGKHCSNDELASCNVHWVDVANVHERLLKMAPWQHINHFPGMTNIARKGKLASNLEKMRRAFPKEYGFYPRTWILPLEMGDFRTQFDSKGVSSRVYIIKPDAGCQGRGIFLTQDLNKVPLNEQMVAQQYIRKPLLIDGFKFDLRIYILVTSCSPLRMYMFHDGLVRLCTSEYVKPTQENLSERCMHLTNYAINKMSDKFVQNDGVENGMGSKRTLKWFMDWVSRDRGASKAQQLWKKIGGVAVKVVSSILPTLQREYGEKFERNKHLKEFRRRAEATAALIAETNRANLAKENSGGTSKGFAFGSGREDMTHRVRRAEAAAAALEKLKEEEAAAKMAKDNKEEEEEGQNNGKSHCFELLGIDIMIDNSLKPWLIEINHLPSFATDSPLDKQVKSQVIEQTLKVVTASAQDRKMYDESNKRDSGQRLYGRASSLANKEGEEAGNNKNRPSISPITTNRPETISVATAKKKITAIYAEHAPERLTMVDSLLAKYSGREAKLVNAVEAKYGKRQQDNTHDSYNSSSASSSADGGSRSNMSDSDSSDMMSGAAGLVPEEGAWNHVLSFDAAVSVPRAGVIPALRRRPSHSSQSSFSQQNIEEEDEEDEDRERIYDQVDIKQSEEEKEIDLKNKENRDDQDSGTDSSSKKIKDGKDGVNGEEEEEEFEVATAPRREQGDLCDLTEARRRIEAMYSSRWRHGMTQSQHSKVLEMEDTILEDFDRIFPLPKDLLPNEDEDVEESSFYIPDYDRLFKHAFVHDDKKFKRMYGARTSTLSAPADDQGNSGTNSTEGGAPLPLSSLLPPIGGGGFCFGGGGEDKGGRNVFGDPFKQGKSERAGDAKLLPKPGPKQAAAAERLTRGFSVLRQSQSAPSGTTESGQANVEDREEGNSFDEVAGSRHTEQIAYAKKLRERTLASKNKRNAVALKPTMYCFTDSGPMLGQSSSHFGSFGQAGF